MWEKIVVSLPFMFFFSWVFLEWPRGQVLWRNFLTCAIWFIGMAISIRVGKKSISS